MATPARHLLAWIRAPINRAAFSLRRRLAWSRGRPRPVSEPKEDLFDFLSGERRQAAERRAAELRARYRLDALWQASTRLVLCENLCLLDSLERLTGDQPLPEAPSLRALDAGSGDFRYATALQRFFAVRAACEVRLTGIEVDGHGIYRDGHSRADHGRAHAELAAADYAVADFGRWPSEPVHAVTMLYPFLTRYALLRWGLPPSLFRPRALLARAVELLVPGGWLLVCHQTEREQEILGRLVAGMPLQWLRSASLASDLVPYAAATSRRCGTLLRRSGNTAT